MSATHCQYCGTDPCRGVTNMCDIAKHLAGDPQALPVTTTQKHVLKGFVLSPGTYTGRYVFKFDGNRGHWVSVDEQPAEPETSTKRACECGVWATGGLCSDWCPLAGGDCVQKEDR